MRHIWDTEEQQEVLASLVEQAIAKQAAARAIIRGRVRLTGRIRKLLRVMSIGWTDH